MYNGTVLSSKPVALKDNVCTEFIKKYQPLLMYSPMLYLVITK